jgi:MOSC domain-containing protein YiiM
MVGELVSIVFKPAGHEPNPDGYTRIATGCAQLVAGHGIVGDLRGGGRRHINIMTQATVSALGDEGFFAAPGQLGEQLIVAGVDVDALPVGSRIRIGETACIELTEPRTGCAKFERHQGRSRNEVAGRIGMMACVVETGPIQVGDPVEVL